MLEGEAPVEVLEQTWTWNPLQAARNIIAGGATDEPFYVADLREPAARLARWRALLPRVEPFYAVKCNDDRMLLRALAALGAGFDCASKGEIELLTGLGVAPERIIYANTVKLVSHIRYADSVGVDTMTFDSEAELIKIKQHMPHAQVVLRIRCDATRSQLSLGEKFGCDPVTEAPALLKMAAALDIDLIGVSFHVGTNVDEPDAYARGIKHCRDLFTLGAEAGLTRMRLVDIGGGFPGQAGSSIEEVSAVINAALEKHFPDPSVRVIAEPGRYFSEAAYTLAVLVQGKRKVAARGEAEARTMYYINAGIYSAFSSVPSMDEIVKPILLHPSTEEPEPCTIWGPSCCSLDRVVASASLPPLQVGSWLLFQNMGAYTMSLSTNFCGFEPPRIRSFIDRRLWSLLKNRSPFSESHFSASAAPCARSARESDQDSCSFQEIASLALKSGYNDK